MKTYKNKELQNRQQENITVIYTKKTEVSKLSTSYVITRRLSVR